MSDGGFLEKMVTQLSATQPHAVLPTADLNPEADLNRHPTSCVGIAPKWPTKRGECYLHHQGLFWYRERESNPHLPHLGALCYPLTLPLQGGGHQS